MTNKYGPTRKELMIRLGLSLAGLALMLAALLYRGLPTGPGGWEAIGIAALFFGGTTLWTLWKLMKKDYPDGL